MGPFGQLDVLNALTVGPRPEVQLLVVHQERRVLHVKLGDELLHVTRVRIHRLPLLLDAFE